MTPKKVTLIISDLNKSFHFEWVYKYMDSSKIELTFIFIGDSKGATYEVLEKLGAKVTFIKLFSKKDYAKALFLVIKALLIQRPEVVHTHLFKANLLGLLAAKILGIKKRVYTRHHSTFHHEYYPKAVKWDLLNNFLAHKVIAISENVKKVLLEKESLSNSKIALVYHGFELKSIGQNDAIKVGFLKKKYNLSNIDFPVVGVISRFLDLKGIDYIIDAFKLLKKDYSKAILILANATGSDSNKINKKLENNLSEDSYIKIAFEEDIYNLYNCFDLFIHVPINENIEAFGQTYIEALATCTPSIFTLSGIANEFISHKKNAWVVDYKSDKEIYNGMKMLMDDKNLRIELTSQGKNDVLKFSIENHIEKLISIYLNR